MGPFMFDQARTGREAQREQFAWPVTRLGELVESLAEHSGLLARQASLPQAPESLAEAPDEIIGRWIDSGLQGFGLEAETLSAGYGEVAALIGRTRPLILNLPGSGGPQLVGVLSGSARRVKILAPDQKIRRMPLETLRHALCAPIEDKIVAEIDRLLDDAGTPFSQRSRARTTILRDQLGNQPVQAGWVIRHSPGAKVMTQLRSAGQLLPVSGLLIVFILQQLLGLLGWIVIGRGIFQGQFDWAWMTAWVLILISAIPLGMMVSDFQAEISLSAGSIFKQRLLYGILNLKPDEIRHQGMGQFLGRVMELEAVEMLAFSGGFSAILALIELSLAGYVLSKGATGGLQTALLFAWLGVVLVMLWRNFRSSREWAQAYREMTNELVENMVGHRTRLI